MKNQVIKNATGTVQIDKRPRRWNYQTEKWEIVKHTALKPETVTPIFA